MRILAIESSCDETALAVVSDLDPSTLSKGGDGLSTEALAKVEGGCGVITVEKSLLATQIEIHKLYGGVVPEVAAREHVSAIFPMLIESGISRDGHEIDVIAVTAGPGLVPALRIGVELAKTLAWMWKKPLVAVNHLEGHVYSVWPHSIGTNGQAQDLPLRAEPQFPTVCLLVSGGHTELFLMRDHGEYEPIGMTRDDAAGEAFDKVANLLGLGYPGGPIISKTALEGNPHAIAFPRPMHASGDFDFSFSGLKTAVRVYLENQKVRPLSPTLPLSGEGALIADVAASFQQAVVDSLVDKTLAAVSKFQPRSVILSGGVSANHAIRTTLRDKLADQFPDITFHAPDLSLTGDNAVMIAIAGLFRAKKKQFVDPLTLEANPNMKLV